jgi:alpha-1,2-mannosyltransferase
LRLLPFYLWLAILTAQSHKEERFFFPAYPLLCFNAAVGIYLVKGWLETFYIYLTNSPYEVSFPLGLRSAYAHTTQASRSSTFSTFTTITVLLSGLISVLRIFSIHKFYHAPFDILLHFQYSTVPSILAANGYTPVPLPDNFVPYRNELPEPEWDYSVLNDISPRVTLCYGGEWHRYPGSYLVPEGIQIRFLQTDFDGMMPRPWEMSSNTSSGVWPRSETRVIHPGRFNGENKASLEAGTFVQEKECTHLVALNLPSHKQTKLEPNWAAKREWEEEYCKPFLDGQGSKWWARLLWFPWGIASQGRVWGEYCLLRRSGV